MRCEYGDGFKVDYEGSLRITKGDDVNIFVKESFIPGNVQGDLQMAAKHNSCDELRRAAREVTDTVHGAWERE